MLQKSQIEKLIQEVSQVIKESGSSQIDAFSRDYKKRRRAEQLQGILRTLVEIKSDLEMDELM